MRLLSLVLLVTLSYVSAAAVESKICIQGGAPPAECPNNNKWNSVTCRFECLPHCVSNEGNFIFPDTTTGGTSFRQLCNSCNCKVGGTVGICTKMGCDSSLCWDDAGNSHQVGEVITSGCKTGTCTKVNGKGVWSWYSPASSTTKPNCPYGPGIYNKDTCKWECPSTCQDGSTPRKCANGGQQPCAVVRCGFGTECTDNYCPNYPNTDKGACTAKCVRPVQCTKNPCQAPLGQPKCGKNQVCEADYRFGCGYQCKDMTCEFNGELYQVGDSRPSEDGCNTCGCGEDGNWACTEKACVKPTEPKICIQGGAPPAQCPTNNRWNSVTCQFECVCPQNQNCGINGVWDYENCRCGVNTPAPATKKPNPICAQGGAPPAECPNNNKWNPVTCKFECVCPQNQNCGINGVWDYDNCRCVVPTAVPTTCPQNQNCGINGVWDSVNCRCVVNTPAPLVVCAPPSQQKPVCDLGTAVFDKTTCKWTCPKKCANGSNPPACLVNPCATILCAANSQCVVNSCPNFPNTEQGPCTATCQPITNCLVSPCSVNSCGKGQTCVDDYVGGCNYRCKDKFRM